MKGIVLRTGTAACAVLAALSLGSLWAIAASPAATVLQTAREFSSRSLSVPAASVVRFVNQDDFPHQLNVTGPGMDYDSELEDAGQVTELAFPRAGTFEVRCAIHPRMRLTIKVSDR